MKRIYTSIRVFAACVLAGTTAFAGSELLFENSDFEKGTLENWTAEGDAMSMQPTKGDQLAARKEGTSNIQGEYWIGTAEKYDGKSGKPGAMRHHAPTGKLLSKEFTITKPYITFRIGGGPDYQQLNVGLIVDGKELVGAADTTPRSSDTLTAVSLNVKSLMGKKTQLIISDQSKVRFGYISADDFRASDEKIGVVYTPIERPKVKDSDSTFPYYKRVGYDQDIRPQFHFTSRMGWLNDPNGLVYYDGEWHMYFQHYAKGNLGGTKSWGNSVSTDLVHWTQLPHAITPYAKVDGSKGAHAIWSGSAVVDKFNALGKQKNDVKTLFALYSATSEKFFQAGAYSTDRGRTWTKVNDGKPLIPHQEGLYKGQRDPRIFYYAPGKFYVTIMMVVGKDRAARLWKSTDLLNWKQFLDIPNKSAECLDMYCLPVDGDKNNMKWVISSAQTFYEVGDFDGDKWTGFGNKDKKVFRFDHGTNYYAAQTFTNGPDGRVVQVGWMNTRDLFTKAKMPFTQQMSTLVDLSLRTTPDGIRMFRNPVKEIESLYTKSETLKNISAKEANAKLASLSPELIDMTVEFAPSGSFDLNVRGEKITYNAKNKVIIFTNMTRKARIAAKNAEIAKLPKEKQKYEKDDSTRHIPAPTVDGKVIIRTLIDKASVEVFINNGQVAGSFVTLIDKDNRKIAIEGDDAMKFDSIIVHELKSAWDHVK